LRGTPISPNEPNVQRRRCSTPSTTSDENCPAGRFQITHPFHPYFGRDFALVTWRHNWAEDRVYFQDGSQRLRSVSSQWTDLVADDPVVVIGEGRAHLRIADMLELADLLKGLRS
jgi:hypothetical protein